jgi:hypothetical protein
MAIDLERECFFIAPIGDDGSAIRKRSDGVQELIVKEAAEAHDLETRRADDFGEPGQITSQIVHHCLNAKMCVADLTDGNPNVYYELSVRHGKLLPVVLIAEHNTELPFDVGQSRVIFFDHTNLTSAIGAREEVREQIGVALEQGAPADNPISTGMRLGELQSGDGEGKALALVMEQLERLSATTAEVDSRLKKAEHREAIQRALQNRVAHDAIRPTDGYTILSDFVRSREEEASEASDTDLSPNAFLDDEITEENGGESEGPPAN